MIEPTTWEQLLQFVNRGGFAWQNLLGQDKFYPWTPTDASGAGLTFTSVSAHYYVTGKLVWAAATFIYPTTADGTNTSIGGFPFATLNLQSTRTGNLTFHNGATATKFFLDVNARTGAFYTNAGVNVTNAQMSGAACYINAVYLKA